MVGDLGFLAYLIYHIAPAAEGDVFGLKIFFYINT